MASLKLGIRWFLQTEADNCCRNVFYFCLFSEIHVGL